MTLSRDLFLSILAMDAYNRDYGFGVKVDGTQIGNARIRSRDGLGITADQYASWQATGFYAIAYDVSDAEIDGLSGTVISYRGSDYQDTNGISPFSRDIWQGWSNGAGFPYGGQPRLALDFYSAVTGKSPYNTPGNYTITGHSLGGSLAGFVSALSGNRALLFDHVPFGIAAYVQAHGVNVPLSLVQTGLPDAYHVLGEVAIGTRLGGLPFAASLPLNAIVPFVPALAGGTVATGTAALELAVDNQVLTTGLSPIASLANTIQLHSQALLVTLLWARDNANVNWQYAAASLIPAYFSEAVANSIPEAAGYKGEITSSGYVLQSAIAYSAIDEGERPFGDVGIRAMFDDAADFGSVLRYNLMPTWAGDSLNDSIGRIIVEFAGLMAVRDVEALGDGAPTANAAALEGILSLDGSGTEGVPDALRISFSDTLWSLSGRTLATPLHESRERTGLVDATINAVSASVDLDMISRWYSDEVGGNLLHDIDEIVFAFSTSPNFAASSSNTLSMFVTGDASVSTTLGNSNNFVVSGAGSDAIDGGTGTDIIVAGDGVDVLRGGSGDDWLAGGEGGDILEGGDNNDYLSGGYGADNVDGGDGDDELVANFDNEVDELDGGSGTDTVVFAYDQGDSTIRLTANAQSIPGVTGPNDGFGLEIVGALNANGSAGNFGGDQLISLELAAVQAGTGEDTLRIEQDINAAVIDYIDLGRQTSGAYDHINLSNWQQNLLVDLSSDFVSLSGAGGNALTIEVRGAEAVTGGDGDDILVGNGVANRLVGGLGDDSIDGDDGRDILVGGLGNDTLTGGQGNDRIDSAEDEPNNSGSIDNVFGGEGADRFFVNGGDIINDIDGDDILVSFSDLVLQGGEREEGETIYVGRAGEEYELLGSDLKVTLTAGASAGTSITISNFTNGYAGISLTEASDEDDPRRNRDRNNPGRHFPNSFSNRDPLVLDLDGNGVSMSSLTGSNVFFDLDGDGFAERTGWVGAGEGFLAIDSNNNGVVDNGLELFGSATRNGFEALAEYDGNDDGRIDSADAVWDRLIVWRDANRNGISEATELTQIDQNDVFSIGLQFRVPRSSEQRRAGNTLLGIGSFSEAGGFEAEAVAVAFRNDQTNTRFVLPDNFTYDDEVLSLPNLKGYGDLPDLWVAMTLDPILKQMVQDFVTGSYEDISDFVGRAYSIKAPDYYRYGFLQTGETTHHYEASAFENILARWAGVPVLQGELDEFQIELTAERIIGRSILNDRGAGNPNFHAAFALMSQDFAARFAIGWANALQNGSRDNQISQIISALNEATNDEEAESLELLLGQILNGAAVDAITDPFLRRFSMLQYEVSTNSILGDTAAFIDAELESFEFDAQNPNSGWLEWYAGRSTILNIIDPEGSLLDVRRRAYTGNRMLGVFFNPQSGIANFVSGNGIVVGDADGFARVDVLSGGQGNDNLQGGRGDDTYVLADGFGQDIVIDSAGANDEVAFQGTLRSTLAVLTVEGASGRDLRIRFKGRNETVLIKDYLDASGNPTMERITFPDGPSWSGRFIRDLVMAQRATSGDDRIRGTSADETLIGGAGNDILNGSLAGGLAERFNDAGDIFDGGLGNDGLNGSWGDDVYRFARGDGHDIVSDVGGFVTIELGRGISPTDISIRGAENGQDLILRVSGEDQSIILRGALAGDFGNGSIRIIYADGTIWTEADVRTNAVAGTDGNDALFAFLSGSTLAGGEGNDRLRGYIGDDILIGGRGNDQLGDIFGRDEFRFSRGDGHDFVTIGDPQISNVSASETKTIAFDNSVTLADLSFEQSDEGHALVIRVTGEDQSITISDFMLNIGRLRLRFTNGDVFNGAHLLGFALTPTEGDDRFIGSTASETILGGNGNDELIGGMGNGNHGDDTLDGGSGNDILVGRSGTDILIGSTGNDLLRGGVGADAHRFARGDGHDIIEFAGLGDYVEFASGITLSDILAEVSDDGSDLILRIAGEDQSITLRDVMFNSSYGANEIRFVNEPATTIDAFILSTQVSTAGNDHINGSYHGGMLTGGDGNDIIEGGHSDELIDGGSGDDILSGGGGTNIFLFGLGSGADILKRDSAYISSQDAIEFGVGVLPEQIEISASADGNTIILTIVGTSDSLTIERGHPVLRTGEFRFENDVVWTPQQLFGALFGATPGNDVLFGSAQGGLLEGLDGNDLLSGGTAAQIFVGGRGDDRMEGNQSYTDVYRFSRGDGQDLIVDTQNQNFTEDPDFIEGSNIIEFGEDIEPDDIAIFNYSDGTTIRGSVMIIAGSDDRIYFEYDPDQSELPVSEVRFANGTSWTSSDLFERSGSGVLNGSLLSPGEFNNVVDTRGVVSAITGSGGNDVYIFNQGYGELIIDQSQIGSFVSGIPPYGSVLRLGAGINPDNLAVSTNEQGDMILSLNEHDRVVLLRARSEAPLPYPSVTESYSGVMRFEFADGSSWEYADAIKEIYRGKAGQTTLTGDLFGGTFDTRGFATEIFSVSPRDTFVFNQGYGHIRINIAIPEDFDFGVELGENLVNLGGGLSMSTASLRTTEAGDLIIDFGDGDVLEFVNSIETDPNFAVFRHFGYLDDGFEQTSFATLLDMANTSAVTDAMSSDPETVVKLRGDLNDQYFDPKGAGDVIDGGGGYDDIFYQRGYGELTIHIARDLGTNDDYRQNTVFLNFVGISSEDVEIRTGVENELIVDLGDGDVIRLQFTRDPALDLTDRTYFLPAYGDFPLYYGGALSFSFDDGATLDGPQILALIDQNDTPIFGSGEYYAEVAAVSSGLLTLAGEFEFSDADLADTHGISVVDVALTGNASGLPPASELVDLLGGQIATEAAGANNGAAHWFFSAESSLFDYLGDGETVTLNYSLQIDDGRQGLVMRNVEIMVTGTNQTPGIIGGVFGASLSPNTPLIGANGEIRFTDVDQDQTHTINLLSVSVDGVSSGLPEQSELLSWLSLSAPTGAGASKTAVWSFDPGVFDFDYLGLSDRLQLTYQVEIRDALGAAITRDVTIVLEQSLLAPDALSAIDGTQFVEDSFFDLNIPSSSFESSLTGSLLLTASLANGSALPTWLSFDGTRLTGNPPPNFNGTLDLRIVATNGTASVHDFVSIEIAEVNDAPVVDQILPDYRFASGVAVDIAIPANAFVDVDGDALSFAAVLADGSALPSWLNFNGTRFAGAPPADFTGALVVRLTASDGNFAAEQLFNISVALENAAPSVAQTLYDWQISEDENVNIVLREGVFRDADGDMLVLTARLADGSDLPAWLSFDGSRITGTPPANFNGVMEIAISASDGQANAVDTFNLTINPVNDAPVSVNDSGLSVVAGAQLLIDPLAVLANDSDADGDTLAIVGVDSPVGGLVQINADGRISFEASESFVGIGSFRYTVSDGNQTSSATVTVNVQSAEVPWTYGTAGNDTINGSGNSRNRIDGLAGSDNINGGQLNDELLGGDSNDNLYGNAGDDVLRGGNGDDFIYPGSGIDLVDGGIGADRVLYSASASGVAFSLLNGGTAGDALGDTYVSVEWAAGSAFNDIIEGDNFANYLFGDNGSDELIGLDGNDTLQGGNGADVLRGGAGNDTMIADRTDNAADTFYGDAGNDYISVGYLDSAYGDDGNDQIDIRGSNSAVYGGSGVDDFDLKSNATNVSVDGGEGFDYLDGAGWDLSVASLLSIESITGSTDINNSFAITVNSTSLNLSAAQFIWYLDLIAGTNADTTIIGPGAPSNPMPSRLRIYGAGGNDSLTGSLVADHLTGGAGNDFLAGNTGTDIAYFSGAIGTYTFVTNGGAVTVVDNEINIDGNDGTDTLSSIEQLSFQGGVTVNVASPIILDLDGNGIETLSASESAARYDLDGDSLADDTSWIGSTEGFLFLDRDGNGTVSNAGEFSFIDDVAGARSDLEGLRAFDSNRDGILSALDTRFSDFRIWQDKDGDGAAESGEILSFTQAGVRSIGLTGTAVNGTTQLGDVAIINRGTYTRTNGTTRQFVDAALTYYSAASNIPEIAVQSLNFERKSRRYSINYANGQMAIAPNKRKGEVDARAGVLGASSLLRFANETTGLLSPIILDLDGDGVEMRSIKKASASFDMNGDGILDDTGWAAGGDGFLVIDRNNDGRVNHASELSFASEDKEASSDLEALTALDSNEDGVLNASDARFGELKVWSDTDGDGVTDTGELKTLAQHGITEIAQRAQHRQGQAAVGSNILLSTAVFTRSNGTTGTLGNVALAYRPGSSPASDNAGRENGSFISPRTIGDHETLHSLGLNEGAETLVDAVTALRSSNGPASLFNVDEFLRDGLNPFDYFENAEINLQPMETDRANSTVAQRITTAHSQKWQALNSLEPDRMLSLIAQDMASFGVRSGEGELAWRKDGIKPIDFYA
ncbi:tandem-95 repeat protein [Sphingorhabdus pulchriflava]|uniref:Tandem-95 repeat protein n=2 Tax=Sphingorhabdus TaxID=1434046 RepID=A0A371BIK3_9SPHN|nr:tandem-95 repeat protein [Sphingorhabdus pulchriflava]RDV07388.1 tandem-95 repeat protein [Sphingorhabdus pulchriflava]